MNEEIKPGKYFITFSITSKYPNCYRVVYGNSWEEAHYFAMKYHVGDYSMVYSEEQWINYEGKSLAQRFNLKEITV